MSAKDVDIVISGMDGWWTTFLLLLRVTRISANASFGTRRSTIRRCSPRHAFASVLPSHYEGYGLPVIEALSPASVTVTSDSRQAGPLCIRFYATLDSGASKRGGLLTVVAAEGAV